MTYYDAAYSTRATVENTKHYTQLVIDRNVPGALVECGIAGGAQIGAMLTVSGKSRWIYGFDSFEGIPLASKDDEVQPGIGVNPMVPYTNVSELLKSSGITVHSKESVRNNLNRWTNNDSDNVVLVKGWFQHSLAPYRQVFQQLGGIALLRLDGDLYESTKVCLGQLFPLLSEGGILIVDDWQLVGCKKACQEFFAFYSICQIAPPYGTEDDGPAYFIKRSVPALQYRMNTYSQNGEDGIFKELLSRIDSPSQWVCEFGAWDGIQCSNTFRLVKDEGYNAVFIEGREDYYQLLLETSKKYPSIYPIHQMVEHEGEGILDNILTETPIPIDFDILSIDIDSYDYQVWKSVEEYTPKFVIIEINSSISPIDKTHIHSSSVEGTGFYPMVELGQSKGYTLICHTGNLIFVRNDLTNLYEDLLLPSTECYRSNWMFY
jgi:hypothetical protein